MFTSQGGQSAQGVLRPIKNADPEVIQELIKNAKQQAANKKKPQKDLGKSIILYKNGFKIGEDGDFRDISDPKNKAFLEEIKQGAVPYELQQELREKLGDNLQDEELGVALINKSNEEYVPEKPKFAAFKGEGFSLKNDNNNNNNNKIKQSFANAKPKELSFDDKEDNIVIQLILYNGEKVRLKINSSKTIFDLYCHIQYISKQEIFDLLAGFPPKLLEDPNQNVKDAGLNGARVTQKVQ